MNILEATLQEIEQKVTVLKNWIGNGQVADFHEYQRMVGEIKGLLYTHEYILDLKQRAEHLDDE